MYQKSQCNEEGQIVYSNGSAREDRTCTCDYRAGYAFLREPAGKCFCSPLVEDCSCYKKTCTDQSLLNKGIFCNVICLYTLFCFEWIFFFSWHSLTMWAIVITFHPPPFLFAETSGSDRSKLCSNVFLMDIIRKCDFGVNLKFNNSSWAYNDISLTETQSSGTIYIFSWIRMQTALKS